MSYRNRPVLDRKHRPRWQDELRSQQLIVAGFAMAIAVAVGIFGAVAWSSFYDGTLRQVAVVEDRSLQRADLTRRADLISAQLTADYLELASQSGGVRDQVIQQQLQALQQAITAIEDVASDSLVTGVVLDSRARQLGLSVPEAEVDAAIADRFALPARVRLSLILVQPEVDEDAEEGAEPTEEDWAAARAEIDGLKAQLDDGASFAELATEHSDDASAQSGGLLGWTTGGDSALEEYFDAAGDAPAGEVVGPVRSGAGWYLVRVDERLPERRDEQLDEFLAAAGISAEQYRAFVRQELLQQEFRAHFAETVVGRYAPQRQAAQIQINSEGGQPAAPAPKIHIRHLLVQPLPGEQDQSTATDAQWRAALEQAEELREAALEPDANWFELADESDDAGSRTRGGSVGWHDPATLETQFVAAFAEAAQALDVGEVSEPVRSEFGYHIIEVTDRRVSVMELASRLVDDLRDDPDTFAEIARVHSEDPVTAERGGDLGWVAPYELEEVRQEAIFGLAEPGDISDPIVTDQAVYIFKLIDVSPSRFVPRAERERIAGGGFSRWLDELKEEAGVWIDPQVAPATGTGGGTLTP